MLDIQFIRDNPELVQRKTEEKGYKNINIAELLRLDEQRRGLLTEVEDLRAQRNILTAEMKGQKPSPEQIEQGKKLRERVTEGETKLRELDGQYWLALKAVPNVSLDIVPVGASEDENVVIRTYGEKPEFDFTPKNHWEIAEAKGWLDKERAAKIAGNRFVYLKGDLVLLEFALWQHGLNTLTNPEKLRAIITGAGLQNVSDKPFTPVLPPAMARTEVYQATGRLNKEEQTYKIEGEDLWLNASAEHTLSPMYIDEILPEVELPIRLVGYTTAFRREAGTYGKDTEGFLRLHQFNKLEMESFTTAETSFEEHLFLVAIQEHLMQTLGLHHQVLEKCTADIGLPNVKGVDLNVWLPGQGQYRETHTADYITDYQARPMKTRVRRTDGTIELVHTNDATAFSQRPLIAIIENFQTPEGDVIVPEVLRPYMGGRERI
ncbi:serine--tRNA ligase [Candidatus Saccharibacteria bacterium]|nr:serine--tRNA ligase [Candidatus Saccharibacteria bacterium]HPR09925.1 serine--tRNA ligase [Candidatus Saccharibacteria bacterium]